jgi:plasmid stabilization system protein ParE
MAAIVWTESAQVDLERHYDFLAATAPEAAANAIQVIVSAGASLAQNPKRGAVVEQVSGLRKLPVRFGKVGFVLHYVILEQEVVILRIYHGREQRPV